MRIIGRSFCCCKDAGDMARPQIDFRANGTFVRRVFGGFLTVASGCFLRCKVFVVRDLTVHSQPTFRSVCRVRFWYVCEAAVGTKKVLHGMVGNLDFMLRVAGTTLR